MPTYRLLFLRESFLEGSLKVVARDVVEAVEKASGTSREVRVEIWSDKGRLGIIGTPSRP